MERYEKGGVKFDNDDYYVNAKGSEKSGGGCNPDYIYIGQSQKQNTNVKVLQT